MKNRIVSTRNRVVGGLILSLLFIAHSALPLYGQDYQQMRDRIDRRQKNTRAEIENLNQRIKDYQQRLNKTEKKYDQLYRQTQELQQVIKLQNKKIEKLEQERQHIQQEISVTQNALEQYQYRYRMLKKNFKESLSYLYKNGRSSELALLLTSNSINQMLIRSFYLSRFEQRRQQQMQKIKKAQRKLKKLKEELVASRNDKEQILSEIRQERMQHAKQKKQLQRNIAILKQNQQKIENKLKRVHSQKEQLSSTLTELIQKEKQIRAEQKRKREAARKRRQQGANQGDAVAATTAGYVSNERLNRIEMTFSRSRGDLPWPVEKGVITEHFGRRTDPVLGTQTMNLGIDIATDPKSPVRVVHPGYVFAVRPLPGYGDLVFVNHGKFKTVYGNLSDVMVRRNTFLQQGDVVGLSGTTNSPKGETVFFMIRRNSKDLNPAKWLSER